ncbi:hypothetical protein [Haloarchaeobius sp. DFWS5]|uniref:hypothetical protein n=1 Tax=Haloarchaeobius sp. DFWS5 TaxID=3446114 RepID=UPI003EBD7AED
MPSTSRRRLLAALGTAATAGLAGCNDTVSGSGEPPAGSIQFVNEHDLPHSVEFVVIAVGDSVGDDTGPQNDSESEYPWLRGQTAGAWLEPGETKTYEEAFHFDTTYLVEFTVDDEQPPHNRVSFSPTQSNSQRGHFLGGRVDANNEFAWVVSSTDDTGDVREL